MGNYAGFDPHVSNEQFLQFGYQPQIDNTQIPYNSASVSQHSNYTGDVGAGLNQLARRPANHLAARDRGRGDSSDLHWTDKASGQQMEGAWGDDLNELKQRAQAAKREAQSKRKQIPPFVQKLARWVLVLAS